MEWLVVGIGVFGIWLALSVGEELSKADQQVRCMVWLASHSNVPEQRQSLPYERPSPDKCTAVEIKAEMTHVGI